MVGACALGGVTDGAGCGLFLSRPRTPGLTGCALPSLLLDGAAVTSGVAVPGVGLDGRHCD